MPARPVPVANDVWGAALNAWLDAHANADGSLKTSAVQTALGGLPAGLTGAVAATRYAGGTASGAPVAGTFAVGDFVVGQAAQVWICVTAGTPGTWTCATTSRQQLAATAAGVISEPFPATAVATAAAPVSQTVYGNLSGLRAGDLVTGVLARSIAAAAGTLPTMARFGIADATGKILALSGNDNALALWPVGANPHAFAAPYTVLADGGYFACMVVNGVWGTTPPTPLYGANTTSSLAFGSAAPLAFTWTGQTDLPAVGASVTTTSGGRAYYLAFY